MEVGFESFGDIGLLVCSEKGSRMAMDVAIWTCMGCNRVWEGKWEGGAWLMASECPYCGKVGIANMPLVRPEGTLAIYDEKYVS